MKAFHGQAQRATEKLLRILFLKLRVQSDAIAFEDHVGDVVGCVREHRGDGAFQDLSTAADVVGVSDGDLEDKVHILARQKTMLQAKPG